VTGYCFVSEHAVEYPVARLCRVAGVNRSGYYQWKNRGLSQRARVDAQLLDQIVEIYEKSRGTYGAPRVAGQLRRRGYRVGGKRVARIMAANGLVGAHARRKWRKGRADWSPAPDLVNRQFTADQPDDVWLADITEFKTGEGKFYVAGVLDIATKRLVGWSMGRRQTSTLVIDAMVMAATRRDQAGPVVHHSDRGSQYTSMMFGDRLADLEITASFGKVGDCFDNAPMESFWATMKKELKWIHGDIRFETRAELRGIIFDYIEVFYNRERHQAALGHRTPIEYQQAITAA